MGGSREHASHRLAWPVRRKEQAGEDVCRLADVLLDNVCRLADVLLGNEIKMHVMRMGPFSMARTSVDAVHVTRMRHFPRERTSVDAEAARMAPEGEYTVKSIVGHRWVGNELPVRVWWKGFREAGASWQVASTLTRNTVFKLYCERSLGCPSQGSVRLSPSLPVLAWLEWGGGRAVPVSMGKLRTGLLGGCGARAPPCRLAEAACVATGRQLPQPVHGLVRTS
jgi:hypothetical protein